MQSEIKKFTVFAGEGEPEIPPPPTPETDPPQPEPIPPEIPPDPIPEEVPKVDPYNLAHVNCSNRKPETLFY